MFTFSEWLSDLFKAAGHKYIKRVPYMSGGKRRYRYIYKLTHMAGGKHVLDPEHMVVGAAFQMETGAGAEVHAHIVSTSGENVTYRLDDGPDKDKVFTVTRAQLAQKLDEKHGARAALATERDKQAKVVADLKAAGASSKQVAREQARLDRLEAALPAPAPTPKSEELKTRAPKKPKSVAPKSEEPASEKQTAPMSGAFSAKMGAARKSVDALSVADLTESAWFPNGVQNEGDRKWASMLALLRQAGPNSVSKYKTLISQKLDMIESFGLSEYAEKVIVQKIERAKYDASVLRVWQERQAAVQYVLDQEKVPAWNAQLLYTNSFKSKVNTELMARGLAPVVRMHVSAKDYASDFDAGVEPAAEWVAPPQGLTDYWYSSPLSIGSRRSTYSTAGVAITASVTGGTSTRTQAIADEQRGVLDPLYKHYGRSPVSIHVKTDQPRASMAPRKGGGYDIDVQSMGGASAAHELAHIIEYEVPLAGVMSGLWLASTSDRAAGVRDAGSAGYQLTGASESEGAQDQIYARRIYGNLSTEVLSTAFEMCSNVGVDTEFAKFAATEPLRAALLMAYMDGDLK